MRRNSPESEALSSRIRHPPPPKRNGSGTEGKSRYLKEKVEPNGQLRVNGDGARYGPSGPDLISPLDPSKLKPDEFNVHRPGAGPSPGPPPTHNVHPRQDLDDSRSHSRFDPSYDNDSKFRCKSRMKKCLIKFKLIVDFEDLSTITDITSWFSEVHRPNRGRVRANSYESRMDKIDPSFLLDEIPSVHSVSPRVFAGMPRPVCMLSSDEFDSLVIPS
ncbi:hypothetical protein Ciccas_001006 [Cichlidogyrus casuarinus]|uniref:Uncharacterized protein n=1 Tax=Cichlidogyrus casuarinus TaxID=1844966 RepID=A0ABD2QLA5_9PLAT